MTSAAAARFLVIALLALSLGLVGCDDDSESDDAEEDSCVGDCPTNAEYNDPESACAELGPGTAYCFDQGSGDYALPTSVNCFDGGHALVACTGEGLLGSGGPLES